MIAEALDPEVFPAWAGVDPPSAVWLGLAVSIPRVGGGRPSPFAI